ncbi:effector-associated constant component EACC1 [Amycolatopsis kentuckyensis]|uniref:effector-associated constant component EACC1 n=1 Tax=Amycolatopsis kentuckyensis TaxID=218823 RepID=UPI00356A3995
MDLRLSSDDDAEVLRSLYQWLRDEPELRGRVKQIDRPPAAGEMGAVADVLMVALGSGGAVGVVASSLKVFFAQPRRSDVEITIETPDGRKVRVNAKRAADPEGIVREVLGRGDDA